MGNILTDEQNKILGTADASVVIMIVEVLVKLKMERDEARDLVKRVAEFRHSRVTHVSLPSGSLEYAIGECAEAFDKWKEKP
jgi:hypothetical protein